ncbi:MAG: hypothetical protein IJJ57_04860 [Ruminococcus sp.]|nr:hypothetical protein [Ruminococcus sp.]
MTANDRIISLVRPEYIENIPSFTRDHAKSCTCGFIAREYPELYSRFEADTEPDEQAKQEMAKIVNELFRERLNKHHV